MIEKRFEDIDASDIQSLVTNGVREARTLDYKQELPGNSDGHKKEFLADVSSFANAAGGQIIYGVAETRDEDGRPTGEPRAATGIKADNREKEVLRLESLIRDGIEPRWPAVRMRWLEGFPNGPVLIIHIAQSWSMPHMVTLMGHSKFYSRTNAGKYQLDVGEIRSAFLLSEGRATQIQRFRDARLARIIANDAPVPLCDGLTWVLHLHPFSPANCNVVQDEAWIREHVRLLSGAWCESYRYNLDGLLVHGSLTDKCDGQYVQVFRNGVIESVLSRAHPGGAKRIDAKVWEERIIDATTLYLAAQRDLGADPPALLMLSLVGARGYAVVPGRLGSWGQDVLRQEIDRDLLAVPDVVLDPSDDRPTDVALKSVFDALWQSAGWSGSKNYTKEGRHVSVES